MSSLPKVEPKYSSSEKMLATKWHGKEDIRVEQHPKPLITEAVSCLSYLKTLSAHNACSLGCARLKLEGYKLPARLVICAYDNISLVVAQ